VLRDFDDSIMQIAERVSPAVVQVVVSGFGLAAQQKGGTSVVERQGAIASGVIVDSSGYIITNAHVVEGANHIRVVLTRLTSELVPLKTSLRRRERTLDATLVGIDKLTDLALLKVEASGLPFVPLDADFGVRIGQIVLAVGSPEGLENTITMGIVSSVARQINLDSPMIYIQTDAPINHGNSGGALVDRNGKLVGINTFILSRGGGSEGLGFAIPEPVVKSVFDQLRQHGSIHPTIIGANAQTITPTLAAGLDLPQDWGVVISDVVPGSAADIAGLRARDIVLAVDNRRIDSLPQFSFATYLHRPDHVLEMQVERGADKIELQVQVVELPGVTEQSSETINPLKNLIPQFGIFVLDVNGSLAGTFPGLRSASGVMVAGKTDYIAAVETGLAVGDVIRSMNGVDVSGVAELRHRLERLKPGDPVVFQVERQGTYQFLTFQIE
jgi:serine protease Do